MAECDENYIGWIERRRRGCNIDNGDNYILPIHFFYFTLITYDDNIRFILFKGLGAFTILNLGPYKKGAVYVFLLVKINVQTISFLLVDSQKSGVRMCDVNSEW